MKKGVKPCLDFLKPPPFPLKAATSGLPLFRAPPKSMVLSRFQKGILYMY